MKTLRTLGLVLTLLGTTGCATSYWQDRGTDFADFLDIGVTYSQKPQIAVYAGFQSLLSVGYAAVDGGMLGLGQGQFGDLPMRNHAAGVVVAGAEQYAFGAHYDPADPSNPEWRGAGFCLLSRKTPATTMEFLQCPKFVHLGWVGLNVNCKIGELLDFVLGWTTLDIGGDDGAKRAGKYDHLQAPEKQ